MTALPWFTPPIPETPGPTRVIVVGAGLAGCTTARALADLGWQVTVVDRNPYAAGGASGNRCALLRPHASRDSSLAQQFFSEAFDKAINLLTRLPDASDKTNQHAVFQQTGALQLADDPDTYKESIHLQPVSKEQASELSGINVATGGLFFPSACKVDITRTCKALLAHPGIHTVYSFDVTQLSRQGNNWLIANDRQTLTAAVVVLANGASLSKFPVTSELTIIAARGQTTVVNAGARPSPGIPLCGRHYLIPQPSINTPQQNRQITETQRNLWQIGASFDRNNDQAVTTDADDEKNIQGVVELLGEQPAHDPPFAKLKTVGHWAAIRATTPDRLPVTGAVADREFFCVEYADLRHGRAASSYPSARYLPGLYVNGGFGSRGLCVAALCAELLAGQITGNAISQNRSRRDDKSASYLQLLHPARFHIRRLKKSNAG